MQYKEYGKTGKRVSCIGFGAMRFDTSKSLAENAELVRYACSMGINYFDTAPGYCADQSEPIFGEAFKSMPGEFHVSTKAMPTSFDTARKAKDQVRRSLDRLGVSKIHFYHIWCLRKMEHYELAMRPGGQYEGLLELQAEGLIDHIVCSSHMPGAEIKRIVEDGKVEGVLLGLNILNFPYRWDGVKAAHGAGCGVVAMNPLGGGAIPPGHEKELAFLAADGETPTEAAIRFLAACPEVTVTLVGFTTPRQVDAACRVAEGARPFNEADLDRIRRRVSENMNAACTGCGYCLDCPQNLPIPSYMQYYNEKQVFGRSDAEMIRQLDFQHNWGLLAGRKAGAAECIECGQCEEACTQRLPIIERLKEIAAWENGRG
ncbi:MAG: aldo/keto reductase [bacterium]|nr:aldo/keto reductase [bacterium]